MVSQSPDKHWIVSHNQAAPQTFNMIDTTTQENATVLVSIPVDVLPARPGLRLQAVEWSADSKHLLVKAIADDGVDHIIFDREAPDKSINLSTRLGRRFESVLFQDKRSNKLYVYDVSGLLQTADVNTGALNVVLHQVRAFKPFGADIVLCVTDTADAGQKNVTYLQGDEAYTLRTIPEGSSYMLGISDYEGKRFVVAGSSADSKAYIYANPREFLRRDTSEVAPVLALLSVASDAHYVGFSANARFLAIQGSTAFAVYDFERNRQFRYDTELMPDGLTRATWMDGHRLSLVGEDKLIVFDFDGTNLQRLVPASHSFLPFFDRDYKSLFTVSPSLSRTDATGLVRSELLVQ